MLWPLAKSCQELHREQIKESFHESAHAVFGMPETARAVLNFNLAHFVTTSGRQHGDEPVQLTVEPYLAKYLRPITFHPAVVIVKSNSHELTHQIIKHSTRPDLVPGIVANSLPATNDIQALLQRDQNERHSLRIVLQIAIEGDDGIAANFAEAGRQSRGTAKVPAKANPMNTLIVRRQFPDHVPGPVLATIVHEKDFEV